MLLFQDETLFYPSIEDDTTTAAWVGAGKHAYILHNEAPYVMHLILV